MQILTIRLGAVGDVLMTLPAIAALGRAFPGAQIDHLVEAGAADAIAGTPALRRTIVVPRKEIAAELKRLRFRAWRGVRRELRETAYDLVVDFHNLLRSALWASAARARKKVVRRNWRELSPLFFDTRVPYDRGANVVLQHMTLVEAVANRPVPVACVRPPLDSTTAREALSARAIPERFVAIAPGSRWPGRALPDRLVREAVDVCRERGLAPLLIGGAREAAHFSRLGAELGVPVTTDLSLRALAGILALAAAVISADSAPLHYADLLERPVIGVFGPSSPVLYGPVFAPNVCLRDPALSGTTSTVRVERAEALFAAIGRAELTGALGRLVP